MNNDTQTEANCNPHMHPKGAIAWMAQNPIAANLLMMLVILAGIYSLFEIRKEVFPSFPSERLTISVPYPGSSPEEVEKAVIVKIEEAIQDIPGIEEIRSEANEGLGVINVEVNPGQNITEIVNKVKVRVDAISSFPNEVEKPVIEEILRRSRVMNVSLYGPLDDKSLKKLGDQIREEILMLNGITQVTIGGERDYEITLEISSQALLQYGLRFDDVVNIIKAQSLDLPGGQLRTKNETISLRSSGQAYTKEDFENLILLNNTQGSRIRLGDIAHVYDGFTEQPTVIEFDDLPAVNFYIDRVGKQSALAISDEINTYISKKVQELPPGIKLTAWSNRTDILKSRISLLLNSAAQGGLLVIIALALFLRPQVAFWVVIGIPFCFLGALALLGTRYVDHSISVISLFGFIMVLGIIVDDAIVTAESAYHRLEKDQLGIYSIIQGVEDVKMPTIFGIITTMLAFMPMLFVTEGIGRFFSAAVSVVMLCLFFSIIETKLILPAHLAHLKIKDKNCTNNNNRFFQYFDQFQQRFSEGLTRFSEKRYQPFLQKALKHRYISLSFFIASLIIISQLIPSGLVRFIYFPNIPSDYIVVDLVMPQNTSYLKTHEYIDKIREASKKVDQRYRKETSLDVDAIEHFSIVSTTDSQAQLVAALIPSTERSITSVELAKWWRHALGDLPGVKSLTFDANAGRASVPINIRFQSQDLEQLKHVAIDAQKALLTFEGTFDVRDTFDTGAPEVDIQITAEGEALGLGQAELARQVRQAFFGAEIQRLQRGRHEVKVYARYPRTDRDNLNYLQNMWIRLPNGNEVPFSVVGKVIEQEGISKITRINRQRVVNVQADVDKMQYDPARITAEFVERSLPEILKKYPKVSFVLSGEAEEQQKSQATILLSSLIVLVLIYAALAIPLKSYWQPLIIMSVIPFGLQGAIIGHFILGKEISIISIVGIVALAGIVVNDALVLIDYINHRLKAGDNWQEAVNNAGMRRFRAVILTSLTTFLGLLPIQLEASIQAQFLKPMAISVAFGVLLATFVTLILVPVLCYIVDDIRKLYLHSKNKITITDIASN